MLCVNWKSLRVHSHKTVVQRVSRCPRNDVSCSVYCPDLHLSLPSTLTDDPLQLHVEHNVWGVMYMQASDGDDVMIHEVCCSDCHWLTVVTAAHITH